VKDSAFQLAVDPRIPGVDWTLLFSNNLSIWQSHPLSDPAVTFDEITGAIRFPVDPVEPQKFLKLRGSAPDE
jgi:hypothetical protein